MRDGRRYPVCGALVEDQARPGRAGRPGEGDPLGKISNHRGHHGRPVAWFEDDVVYAPDGTIRAWVESGGVYDARGRQVGQVERGLFRDPSRRIVAFLQGASDPALLNVQELPVLPTPPMPVEGPKPPRAVPASATARPRAEWSSEVWSHELSGDEATGGAGP